jgi:hypothetical protein
MTAIALKASPALYGEFARVRTWWRPIILVLALISSHSHSRLIVDVRESFVGGSAQQVSPRSASIGIPYAVFDESFSAETTGQWVQGFSVSHRSGVTEGGFEFSTAFSGYASSGPFYYSNVDSYFRLVFSVDSPSTLRLTGALSRAPVGHDVGLSRTLRCCVSPPELLWGPSVPLPVSIAIDPAYTYSLFLGDSDEVSAFRPGPPFSAMHSIVGAVKVNGPPGSDADVDIPLPSWSLGLLALGLAASLTRRWRR